ncbi:Na+/H+ antiporter subunit E [Aurantimonas endophytica]|uniref:Multicomponent Na+:H+ antiporter subunit E n=1 Tax=Aurantimonas endophytica TaxID=1522175 RepID=A0A7W6MPL7_9HYPH|nr:Na+/H+ antiporter subunit E [Aurantimonas endophytica]MBB4003017.1 multicomponent Na+:H+ antiporter subunit E [Aurantimonas endophytica]MCO6403892.1 sodium:proton antiporter [Aurantimonas endophytica]
MSTATGPRSPASLLPRGAGFLALWVVLIGATPKDLPVGVMAAGAAAWTSQLFWPATGAISPMGLLRFAIRFLPQSMVAGVDVARRAFAPGPMLVPGFVTWRTVLPDGAARRAFCAVMSLQPGKLPVAAEQDGTLLVHCLDLRGPILAEIRADEAAFRRVLREGD